jgi:hypothetical protein
MDEQILLSDYSKVTEIITMVGGGDDRSQVSSLSAHCYIPLQPLLAYANQPKPLLPVEIIMWLSLPTFLWMQGNIGGQDKGEA